MPKQPLTEAVINRLVGVTDARQKDWYAIIWTFDTGARGEELGDTSFNLLKVQGQDPCSVAKRLIGEYNLDNHGERRSEEFEENPRFPLQMKLKSATACRYENDTEEAAGVIVSKTKEEAKKIFAVGEDSWQWGLEHATENQWGEGEVEEAVSDTKAYQYVRDILGEWRVPIMAKLSQRQFERFCENFVEQDRLIEKNWETSEIKKWEDSGSRGWHSMQDFLDSQRDLEELIEQESTNKELIDIVTRVNGTLRFVFGKNLKEGRMASIFLNEFDPTPDEVEEGETEMKECIEMAPVVDLKGATDAVLKNMVAYFEKAKKVGEDRMIEKEQFWPYLIKAIKGETPIKQEDLMYAGLPAIILIEVLDEAEPPAQPAYQRLIIIRKGGKQEEVPLQKALPRIAPFAKAFKSPVAALVQGDPATILKVMQKLFGADVIQWKVPAEKAVTAAMPALSALCLVEMYRVVAEGAKSPLFEMKDEQLVIKDTAVGGLLDAFDKDKTEYLLHLFPNAMPSYPEVLIQETKTVLNDLSSEEMNRLFPNINSEYLVNLKESELIELTKAVEEVVGVKSK